jgi:hypothetical protein
MLEAYLDESGIHDGAVFCAVAGYFGRRNHWRHFGSAWIEALSQFGFKLSDFHAKDWMKSEAKRPALFRLAKTISRYSIYPVSMGIVVNDFKAFTLDQRKWLTGATLRRGEIRNSGSPNKPYYVPFLLCLMRVTVYAKIGSKARFYFGLDRTFSDYARALYAQIKTQKQNPRSEWRHKWALGDISFPMSSETPELQAADLLSHLTYLHMVERHRQGMWQVAPPPNSLLGLCIKNSRSKWDHVYTDKNSIRETLQKTSISQTESSSA